MSSHALYSGASGGGTFAAAGEALETYDFDKFERFLEYADDDGYPISAITPPLLDGSV